MSDKQNTTGGQLWTLVLLEQENWDLDVAWTWSTTLSVNDDGSYTVKVSQELQTSPAWDAASNVGFRDAMDLFEFLLGQWPEYTGEVLDKAHEARWAKMARLVATKDRRMAREL